MSSLRFRTVLAALALSVGLGDASPAAAQVRIRVQLEILGFYTNDVENGGEEWTFEVFAGGGSWNPQRATFTSDGDSNPNQRGGRNIEDHMLVDQEFTGIVPPAIQYSQRAWENDRGGRTTFDCCLPIVNDDDEHYRANESIFIPRRPGSYDLTFRGFPNTPDLEHGVALRLTVIESSPTTLSPGNPPVQPSE